MKTLLIVIGLSAAFTFCDAGNEQSDPTSQQLQNLKGTYQSLDAEDWGQGTYGYRTFTFDKGKWTLHFILALDENLESRVFEFRTFGTYRIEEASKVVTGAYNATFYEEKKFVTLKTADSGLMQAFGLDRCGLLVDHEKDISVDGCSLWPSVNDCNEDHDLLFLDRDGQLHFGQRPADNDMCTPEKRPTKLLPAVVKI